MDIYFIDKYKLLIPTHYRDVHISFIIITLRPDASLTNEFILSPLADLPLNF